MANCAIIFDVDGVLLELTRQEEDLFFEPFAKRIDATKLSRDWNSYKIRNDEDILNELIERHRLPRTDTKLIRAEYLNLLRQQLANQTIISQTIAGAPELMAQLDSATLGIATANFREAAKLRLGQAGLWPQVAANAFGADGGGHKHEILGRALAVLKLDRSRIVFIGDNVNDVTAGLKHGVHFIGFSQSPQRRETLRRAGAPHVSANHTQTLALIKSLLTR